MPIKLSDVIENVNSNFGIIETSKHNIVGLYNGSAGTVPSLELFHNAGGVKTALTSDGNAANRVSVYKHPFAQSAATNYVTGTDSLKLETRKGGLISVHDGVLNGGSGGEALYLAEQDPTAGNVSDANRSLITNFTELVQQFDKYETITAAQAQTLANTSNEDFWLSGYHTQHQSTKKLNLDNLVSYIASSIVGTAVAEGLITVSNAGETSEGSGIVGDLNGDGAVTTADLIFLLSAINSPLDSGAFNSNSKAMVGTGEETASVTVPIASPTANSNTEFQLSDYTSITFPSTNTLEVSGLGYQQSLSVPTSGVAYMEISGITVTTANSPFYHDKAFKFLMDVTFTFSEPSLCYPLVQVDYTTSNNTTYTVLYHLPPVGAPNTQAPLVGTDGVTGAIHYPIGIESSTTLEFSSLSESSKPITFLGTFNNGSSSDLPSGVGANEISLLTKLDTNPITKIRFTPVFNTFIGGISIKATEMRTNFSIQT